MPEGRVFAKTPRRKPGDQASTSSLPSRRSSSGTNKSRVVRPTPQAVGEGRGWTQGEVVKWRDRVGTHACPENGPGRGAGVRHARARHGPQIDGGEAALDRRLSDSNPNTASDPPKPFGLWALAMPLVLSAPWVQAFRFVRGHGQSIPIKSGRKRKRSVPDEGQRGGGGGGGVDQADRDEEARRRHRPGQGGQATRAPSTRGRGRTAALRSTLH